MYNLNLILDSEWNEEASVLTMFIFLRTLIRIERLVQNFYQQVFESEFLTNDNVRSFF